MKNIQVKAINFEGGELLGIKTDNGNIYMGLNKFLEEIGFKDKVQQQYQRNKLLKDGYLQRGITTLILLSNGGEQETYAIELDYIPTAMLKFNPDDLHRKSKSLTEAEKMLYRSKLLKYQAKAKDVLAKEFLTDTENSLDFKNDYEFVDTLKSIDGKVDNVEVRIKELERINGLFLDNFTINSHQASKLNKLARETVKTICGGVDSPKYKKDARTYFKQIWLNLCDCFDITTYKDLNPIHINEAVKYIKNWSPINR